MIICYMPKGTENVIKNYFKDIQLNNAQKKWLNEMDTSFIPKHRLDYLYNNFGLELKPIEEFEDNVFLKYSNRDERYRRSKPFIENKLHYIMWLLVGKGYLKIDYEYRKLYFKDLVFTWDEFGLYHNKKLIAYFNQRLFNIVRILEKI